MCRTGHCLTGHISQPTAARFLFVQCPAFCSTCLPLVAILSPRLLPSPCAADGIQAATDLQRCSQADMEQLFGLKPAAAAQLTQWCRGLDSTPVQARECMLVVCWCADCQAGSALGKEQLSACSSVNAGPMRCVCPLPAVSAGEAAPQDAVCPDVAHAAAAGHAPLARRDGCCVCDGRARRCDW